MELLFGFLALLVVTVLVTLLWPATGSVTVSRILSPKKSDKDASKHLVSLIDFLFALVLTLPVAVNQDVVRAPWHANLPVLLTLLIAYYVVIRSFVDWHVAMEDGPYWIRTSPHRSWELRRMYVDFVIVMAYVMLFLSTSELTHDPGADLREFLGLLAVITVLYRLWGILRQKAYANQQQFKGETLITTLVGFGALWGAYAIARGNSGWFSDHSSLGNTITLTVALAIIASYRRRNWHEMEAGMAVSEQGT